ncbi:hypothetical protein M404DRAFT_1005929, partial [Pisolithus tinctorius Marx 270]
MDLHGDSPSPLCFDRRNVGSTVPTVGRFFSFHQSIQTPQEPPATETADTSIGSQVNGAQQEMDAM